MNSYKDNLFITLDFETIKELYNEYCIYEKDVINYTGPLRKYIDKYTENINLGTLKMSIDLFRAYIDKSDNL